VSKSFVERIPFAKILIGLVLVFLVSLGLCGVSFVLTLQSTNGHSGNGNSLSHAIGYELVVMVLSAAGILVTCIVWIVAVVVGNSREKVSQSQKLFDEADDTKTDNKG
jgi:hypothetical protein